MSWKVVDAKWSGLKAAFLNFEPECVASMRKLDIDRLVMDARVVRNRPKIEGTIENARTMLALADEFGSMRGYLASLEDFESQVRDLKKRFKFVGDMGAYHFLWMVGEPVPAWGTWHGLSARAGPARKTRNTGSRVAPARRTARKAQ